MNVLDGVEDNYNFNFFVLKPCAIFIKFKKNMNKHKYISMLDHFCDFIGKQRKKIEKSGHYDKMNFNEIKRVHKGLGSQDIFGLECTKFKGLDDKYIAITFRGQKVGLLRLLHHNFVGDIEKDDKIIYQCPNKGNCCTLSHHRFEKKISNNNKNGQRSGQQVCEESKRISDEIRRAKEAENAGAGNEGAGNEGADEAIG